MAVIMAGMEEGAVEGMREQQQMSSIQARRRFMITDILSSVGNSIREKEKDEEEEDEERKPSGHGLDMRLLFPVLGGHNGHNRVDAESGEEADEDDGEDGERGECGLVSFLSANRLKTVRVVVSRLDRPVPKDKMEN